MAGYAQLPGYTVPNALNFDGFNQGVDALGKGIAQGRTNALNMDIGQRMASGDRKGAAGVAYGAGQLETGLGIDKFGQQADAAALDHERKVAKQMAGVSQMILKAPPEQGRMMWQKMNEANPQMAGHLAKYGIDPNDHVAASNFIIAEDRGYVNPLEDQMQKAQLDLARANIHKAYRQDEPDIVRTMRAAGIDPKSAEGQGIIRNTIKNEDPMSKLIEGAVKEAQGSQSTNALAPPQPQGGIQPQSYNGSAVPPAGVVPTSSPAPQQPNALAGPMPPNAPPAGLILAADGQAPHPAPVAPQPAPTGPGGIFGKMSPERKRILAEAMLMDPKRKAMGEQLIKDLEQSKLSKTAEGENDKAEMGLANQLGRLREMQGSFDPKFLTFQKQGEMWGKALVDKLGGLGPDDQKQLSAYTTFRQNAATNMNRFIKEATGATVGVEEAARLMLETPNAGQRILDGDSPTQFKAKMDKSVEAGLLATARARYLRANGFTGKPWEAGIDFNTMEGIIQKRGAEIDNQLRQSNPKADPMQLDMKRRQMIKQEFGI